MHHAVVDDDIAAKDVPDALMAEADAEGRNPRAEGADDLIGQA